MEITLAVATQYSKIRGSMEFIYFLSDPIQKRWPSVHPNWFQLETHIWKEDFFLGFNLLQLNLHCISKKFVIHQNHATCSFGEHLFFQEFSNSFSKFFPYNFIRCTSRKFCQKLCNGCIEFSSQISPKIWMEKLQEFISGIYQGSSSSKTRSEFHFL